jgi:hypothetical protein
LVSEKKLKNNIFVKLLDFGKILRSYFSLKYDNCDKNGDLFVYERNIILKNNGEI